MARTKDRKKGETRPTKKEKPYIMARREVVLQCRGKLKLSVRETQEVLIQKGFERGSSLGQIQADYDYMLALGVAQEKDNAENFVVEEIDVQNEIHRTFYSAMKKLSSIEIPRREEFDTFREYMIAMEKVQVIFSKSIQAAGVIQAASKERSRLRGNYKHPIELNPYVAFAKLLGVDPSQIPQNDSDESAETYVN